MMTIEKAKAALKNAKMDDIYEAIKNRVSQDIYRFIFRDAYLRALGAELNDDEYVEATEKLDEELDAYFKELVWEYVKTQKNPY